MWVSNKELNVFLPQGHGVRPALVQPNPTKEIDGPKTIEWSNWPAVAYEEVGHPLLTKGESCFHRARALYFQKGDHGPNYGTTLLDEFIDVYKNRPDTVTLCGFRINHAMALFLAVRHIQPTLVVDSGVTAGQSTYFIRAASSTTLIFAIDPLETPLCDQGDRWMDSSEHTTYFTGGTFVDLEDLDWNGMISRNEVDPDTTLVFLDDHRNVLERIAGLMNYGIRHVIVEDNYKINEGATQHDTKSTPKQMFFGTQWRKEGNWLFNNIITYAEFPPIVPPIMAISYTGERNPEGGFMVAADDNKDIVHPMLRPDLNKNDMKLYITIATSLEINPSLKDKDSYMQFMNYNQICHLELLPTPHMLLE